MDPVHHDVVVYSDSMSCLQAIEGEDTDNPLICHIMNLLWSLSDKGTHVRFSWVPSYCGIDGNERVCQLAKETLDQDIDPLASVHYTDMKPVVNFYIQKLVQTKWGCICTWQRSLSCKTNTEATEEVPAPNQSWRGCNHPTLNWSYQGHQIPYLVPRTTGGLSPLWSNADHWQYAAGVCIVIGMSWWILHSRLVECSLQHNFWDLHSVVTCKVLLLCRSWGACVPRRSQRLCQLAFWLLVGTTMLNRLWARGQTKCNIPLMLATSVFGRIHRRPCYVMAQPKSRLDIPWPNDAECMGHVWYHFSCWYPLLFYVESLAGCVGG